MNPYLASNYGTRCSSFGPTLAQHVGGLAVHAGQHVAVGVEGKGDRSVD
jgi:hypothetical protein